MTLSTFAQVELLVAGLHAPPAAGSEPTLSITEADNAFAFAGFNGHGLGDLALPDVDSVFETDAVTEFFVGRWAATGDRLYLIELIRRARNRDGSSALIALSSHAIDVLRVAIESHPEFGPLLHELGFDPENMRFGEYPSTGELRAALFYDEPLFGAPGSYGHEGDNPEAVAADMPADPAEVVSIDELRLAAERSFEPPQPVADVETSRAEAVGQFEVMPGPGAAVTIDVHIGRGGVRAGLILSAAIQLERDLAAAIRAQLLPVDNMTFRWDDSTDLTVSRLVVLDYAVVVRLESETLMTAGEPDELGRYVIGTVSVAEDGSFVGRLNIDGAEALPAVDMNAAKFEVANAVRARFADILNNL